MGKILIKYLVIFLLPLLPAYSKTPQIKKRISHQVNDNKFGLEVDDICRTEESFTQRGDLLEQVDYLCSGEMGSRIENQYDAPSQITQSIHYVGNNVVDFRDQFKWINKSVRLGQRMSNAGDLLAVWLDIYDEKFRLINTSKVNFSVKQEIQITREYIHDQLEKEIITTFDLKTSKKISTLTTKIITEPLTALSQNKERTGRTCQCGIINDGRREKRLEYRNDKAAETIVNYFNKNNRLMCREIIDKLGKIKSITEFTYHEKSSQVTETQRIFATNTKLVNKIQNDKYGNEIRREIYEGDTLIYVINQSVEYYE
ncbi:MAG: hypothetical protein KF713_00035 [Turneriella sp.]|nr:hypothetical protein [Turneriella sp.]